jgi:general stress protein YciG
MKGQGSLAALEISERLLHQQQYTHADQRGGEPAAAVDVFMQQEFGEDGGTDIGK